MEHFISDGENLSNNEWAEAVFKMKVEALNKCNRVVAAYLGLRSDTGTAWEIGYAYAKKYPCFSYTFSGSIKWRSKYNANSIF